MLVDWLGLQLEQNRVTVDCGQPVMLDLMLINSLTDWGWGRGESREVHCPSHSGLWFVIHHLSDLSFIVSSRTSSKSLGGSGRNKKERVLVRKWKYYKDDINVFYLVKKIKLQTQRKLWIDWFDEYLYLFHFCILQLFQHVDFNAVWILSCLRLFQWGFLRKMTSYCSEIPPAQFTILWW